MTSTQQANLHYWRKDITGLRAVAVLPVLIYHAFPNLLPGGFFGVDIFFVISGYLISGIIFRGMLNDSFSYKDFYIKRIKRILPNLCTLLIAVAAVGWFLLAKPELSALGKHIYSSAFFYQNFRLLGEVDYFAVASHEKPLLHLWSLAIEEQFYIVFPIVCMLLWRFLKHSTTAIGLFVALITAGSFLACLMTNDATQRFYLPYTRFWELGAGICIAYAETFCRFNSKNLALELRHCLSVLGLAMIVGGFIFYSKTINTPGFISLLPVLGSAFLILASDNAIINRTLLSWKSMTFIGLISYSLYLWHWPLISYLHLATPAAPQWHYGAALLLAFPISIIVYVFIENPVRRAKSQKTAILLLISTVLCIAFGQALKRIDFDDRPIDEILAYRQDWTYHKDTETKKINDVEVRVFKNTTDFPEILFVGDSHVEQYSSRVKMNINKNYRAVAFATCGGCLVSNGFNQNSTPECKQASDAIRTLLQDPRIKTVVLGQIWGHYQHETPEQFKKGIDSYLNFFRMYGKDKRFFVLLDYPWDNGSYDPIHYINRLNPQKNKNNDIIVDLPEEKLWSKGNQYVEKVFSLYATIIETETKVCPNKKCNLRNYKDDDHLRSSYVEQNAAWIDQVFN